MVGFALKLYSWSWGLGLRVFALQVGEGEQRPSRHDLDKHTATGVFLAAEVAALALCWEYILDVDHVVFTEIVLS